MPMHKAYGLSLQKSDYSNTSQIVTFLTPDQGKLSVLAKGSKRPRSSFGGPFDLLALYDLVYISRHGGLHLLTEAALLDCFPAIRSDYRLMAKAFAVAELSLALTQPEQPCPEVFSLVLAALRALDPAAPAELVLLSFEAKLLHELGVFPELRTCVICSSNPVSDKALLSVPDGGRVCRACAHAAAAPRSVPPAAISLLAKLRTFPLEKVDRLKAPDKLVAQLGALLADMLSSALHTELRSFNLAQPGVGAAS